MKHIKERILQIADNKRIAKEKFCENIGMTYGSFRGKAKTTPINSDAVGKLLELYPDVNYKWLFTGEGEMYISNNHRPKIIDIKNLDKLVEELQKRCDEKQDEINFLRDQVRFLNGQLASISAKTEG